MTWTTLETRGERDHAAMRMIMARAARGMTPVLSDGLLTAINRPHRARSLLDSDHRRGIAGASWLHSPSQCTPAPPRYVPLLQHFEVNCAPKRHQRVHEMWKTRSSM